jgi:peptidoglycan/LPS O-acetylase OafA/YrhL
MRTQDRFEVLDGLRGLAAIVVFQRHVPAWFDGHVLPSGYLAVDFFFALSGFVLAHAYDARLAAGLPWRRFMLARLVRLWPLYMLGVVLMLLARPDLWHEGGRELLLSGLFLPDFSTPGQAWLLLPAWSLAFELMVNLLYASCHRFLGTKMLLALLAAGLAGLLATAVSLDTINVGYAADTLPLGVARAVFPFFLGILLFRYRHLMPAIRGVGAWPVLLSLVVLLAWPQSGSWTGIRDLALVSFTVPALLLLGWQASPGAARHLLAALGAASYGIYVLHSAVSRLVYLVWGNLGPLGGSVVILWLVLMAVLLDAVYDQPLRRWLSGSLLSPPKSTVAS